MSASFLGFETHSNMNFRALLPANAFLRSDGEKIPKFLAKALQASDPEALRKKDYPELEERVTSGQLPGAFTGNTYGKALDKALKEMP